MEEGYSALVIQEVQKQEEAARYAKAAQARQGQWMTWEGVEKITGKELWEMETLKASFIIKATFGSASLQLIYIIKLTVPWEAAVEQAYERKKLGYEELTADVRQRGWTAKVRPVEMGYRGFIASSTSRLQHQGKHYGRKEPNNLEESIPQNPGNVPQNWGCASNKGLTPIEEMEGAAIDVRGSHCAGKGSEQDHNCSLKQGSEQVWFRIWKSKEKHTFQGRKKTWNLENLTA
ncbi:hypothetical protein GJAV_G00041730 [Gymnothorax javanicus]|nr:hypothetical protein GJAV_G00041730 [Gymnothorax javanicus]